MGLLSRLGTMRSRVGPPRQLRITREGWFYGAFTLGVGAAAINTGNNLLYLVLGLQLATIIISGVLSESSIHGLRLTTLGAHDARAGEAATWLLELHKDRGRLPSYTLELRADDGPALGARAGVLRLAPGEGAPVALQFTPPWRGRFVARQVTVSTRFPFGLFEKSRELAVEQELFVYPKGGAAPLPSETLHAEVGSRRTLRAGRGPELWALRAFGSGDGLSQMHWRKSAQVGSWVAADREDEALPAVKISVPLRAEADPDGLAHLERALERAAASTDAALARGCRVTLTLGRTHLDGAPDAAGRRRLLRALAAAEPELGP